MVVVPQNGHSGPSDRRERVTERHPTPGSSDEHDAGSMVRGVSRVAADGEEFTTKPGASSRQGPGREAGTLCECSGVKEHRTGGRSGRRWSRASTLPRYCVSRSFWSPLSCDEILTRGRNRMGQGSHAAGGGAPGWRPRPFGLVGAGSGVGVGRRGEYLRGEKKNSIEHSVPCPTRSIRTPLFSCSRFPLYIGRPEASFYLDYPIRARMSYPGTTKKNLLEMTLKLEKGDVIPCRISRSPSSASPW